VAIELNRGRDRTSIPGRSDPTGVHVLDGVEAVAALDGTTGALPALWRPPANAAYR
jgi:hypothetical protein